VVRIDPSIAVPADADIRQRDGISVAFGNRAVDTAVLSNLGRLHALPDLRGGAGGVRSVWFSPPGRMPLGTSIGTATLGGELFVTLRYRHDLFDAGAAAEFASLYREVLLS
jgi:hypothetical protein